VIRHLVGNLELAEPAVRQVHRHFVTQLPFGTDPAAVTDQQHADHQLGIDRRPPCVAVERGKVLAQIGKIKNAVNVAKQVIMRHDLIEIERVKQLVLRLVVTAHHR